MVTPVQCRFPEKTKKSLERAQKATGIKQAEFIRLALSELFKNYPTANSLVEAVIRDKSAKASK